MPKDRFNELVNKLVNECVKVEENDLVIIECFDIPLNNATKLIDAVYKKKALPIFWNKSWTILKHILNNKHNEKTIDFYSNQELIQMKQADKYISIRASLGEEELSGVSNISKKYFFTNWLGKVHYNERVQNTIWCSCKFPTKTSAKNANLKYDDFLSLFYNVILDFDYEELARRTVILKKIMENTNEVRIETDTTNLKFSIKNIPIVICAANRNLPDGEIRTAPIKESVNGYIKYNVPTIFRGEYFEGVLLEFKQGKIISCSSDNNKNKILNEIFNTDEGSKYIGEFAIGLNPKIVNYTLDTMFDEKILGTIHLTPGNSYKSAFNGNESSIHWDLILDLRSGGKIYFDDKEIMNFGEFVPKELQLLNY